MSDDESSANRLAVRTVFHYALSRFEISNASNLGKTDASVLRQFLLLHREDFCAILGF